MKGMSHWHQTTDGYSGISKWVLTMPVYTSHHYYLPSHNGCSRLVS